jgi:inhibitor of cysteine peptidase
MHNGLLMTLLPFLAVIHFSGPCRKDKLPANCDEPKARYTLKVGEQVRFCLVSNPTTGYSWYWLNSSTVRAVDSVGRLYTPDAKGVPGSGGREAWSFRARLSGRDTLRLGYRRPWEADAPVREVSVIIVVK